MNITDKTNMKGVVELRGYDRNNNLVFEEKGKNLIVGKGCFNMTKLLGGEVTGRYISKIGFGENNTPVADADTSLTNAFTKNVDGVTYPDDHTVVFAFSLGYSEANGKNIVEMGLIHANNDLFNRRVRGLIAKDSSLRLEGTWTISI